MSFIIDPFRFGVVGATTWQTTNGAHKNANVTLSGGNLTASVTTGFHCGVASIASASSGIKYYECIPNTAETVGAFIFGVVLTSVNLAPDGQFIGAQAVGYGWQFMDATPARWNNASQNAYGAQGSVGDVIGVLLNLTAGTLTYYKNGVSQGTAFSSLSGTFHATISILGTGGGRNCTARFLSTSWTNAPGVGETQW